MKNFPYSGWGGCKSVCGVQVIQRGGGFVESPDIAGMLVWRGDGPVVILTELPENDGTSITNVSEYLATKVFYDREVMGFPPEPHDLQLPLFRTVWIEHYPEDRDLGMPESYSLIEYQLIDWSNQYQRHEYRNPAWRALSNDQLAELVGESFFASRS